ncbi:hypothetical protein U9M48_034889 [Paspalum notatum var. saurae]|uniref:ATP-dependent DNA helicase n=1 Tax=Paspalum notatum var. saurae TaxID=547442 RepID=A0AAQ3UBV4_PASNO
MVVFPDSSDLEKIVYRPGIEKSIFTEWMTANRLHKDARDLTYAEFPTKWAWHAKEKEWRPRRGGKRSIGRIYYAHPASGDSYSQNTKKSLALVEIDNLLRKGGKSLKNFDGMPLPDSNAIQGLTNRLLNEELNYDRCSLQTECSELLQKLNVDQRKAFDAITESVNGQLGKLIFVNGYGGTGKTFLWKAITTSLRPEGKIVLAVASSGIAALLLPGGRTAHSRFHIPLNINNESTCNIKQGTFLAELLNRTSLII